MRVTAGITAGTFVYHDADLETGWHHHDLHQLQYALEGVAEVETPDVRCLLPPRQALWIPAGHPHLTVLHSVHSIALYLDPATLPDRDDRARVIAVSPLLREMLHHATRWAIGRRATDVTADTFFASLAGVVLECLDDEVPLSLPTTTEGLVRNIMDSTRADLGASSREIARRVGISERTLRRRFAAVTGMTWSEYVTDCRILAAIPLVVADTLSITQVAHRVGYGNAGTFTRAFRAHTGQTPSRYRAERRTAPHAP
jgi:AraC-like DNA-binding protein